MDEKRKPKLNAKDNPWYRLAILHGEPSTVLDETAAENRLTWNRWMSPRISDDFKANLLKKGWKDEELTPLSENERRSIGAQVGLSLEAGEVDFSNTDFEASVLFQRFIFPAVTFANATFRSDVDFNSVVFSAKTSFHSATFSGGSVSFNHVTFSDETYFVSAVFSSSTFFDGTVFGDNVTFSGTTFSDDAFFRTVTFSGVATFSATFSAKAFFRMACFGNATGFGSSANFSRTTFCSDADFARATFNSTADFCHSTFRGTADFTNAEMKGMTTFSKVRFASPPLFFGAKLHEGTLWSDVTWPVPPDDREEAATYVEAYERLKLEMDRLKKHGDELDFFARELQCRRVLLGPWKGLAFAIYGFLSDYGRSYVRPLGLLVATVLVGMTIFAAHEAGSWMSLFGHVRKAAGISFANTLSLLGKPLLRADAVLAEYPDWLKAVATIQTILGIVLLFLFGLGIRNRFRMK